MDERLHGLFQRSIDAADVEPDALTSDLVDTYESFAAVAGASTEENVIGRGSWIGAAAVITGLGLTIAIGAVVANVTPEDTPEILPLLV
ncbi:MAG: hypothetical protein KY394_06325, partial [Actinobacteria bacterium]|nr:hypothetical protein [Actinomycetota bacterium]